MDLLATLMRELHFAAAGYRRLELAAPWAISFSQAGLRGIHVVIKGRCEAVFGEEDVEPLDAGDLIIAPRADPHVLRSPGALKSANVLAAELATQTAAGRIRSGGEGEKTVILCGAFAFRDADHPALAGLPRIVHIRGSNGRLPKWLRGYVEALLVEATDEGPGSDVVMARLSGAIVTRALRSGLESMDNPGWLRGLQDPAIARALATLHEAYGHDWTIETLARAVGLSRATFAARFRDLVGEAPMAYLFGCRMRQASRLLHEGKSLGQVAEAVGYSSEAAFSTAFRRHAGVSPGQFRKRKDL